MSEWRLARAAADDLASVYVHGLERFGEAQADRYHAELEATFDFLRQYLRAARLREEISPPVRAYRFKAHLIIYEIDPDDAVLILRVRHTREDWMSAP